MRGEGSLLLSPVGTQGCRSRWHPHPLRASAWGLGGGHCRYRSLVPNTASAMSGGMISCSVTAASLQGLFEPSPRVSTLPKAARPSSPSCPRPLASPLVRGTGLAWGQGQCATLFSACYTVPCTRATLLHVPGPSLFPACGVRGVAAVVVVVAVASQLGSCHAPAAWTGPGPGPNGPRNRSSC